MNGQSGDVGVRPRANWTALHRYQPSFADTLPGQPSFAPSPPRCTDTAKKRTAGMMPSIPAGRALSGHPQEKSMGHVMSRRLNLSSVYSAVARRIGIQPTASRGGASSFSCRPRAGGGCRAPADHGRRGAGFVRPDLEGTRDGGMEWALGSGSGASSGLVRLLTPGPSPAAGHGRSWRYRAHRLERGARDPSAAASSGRGRGGVEGGRARVRLRSSRCPDRQHLAPVIAE